MSGVPHKQVFAFQEGHAQMLHLLGGKGANLAEMVRLGLPVPPGFTVTTEACRDFYEQGGQTTEELRGQIAAALKRLELEKGQVFGDSCNPLLVSVRSGSVTSMPGMMDTVLNLGLNDATVEGLANHTHNARFAYDCYRRFIQMYGNVVLNIEGFHFERLLHELKQQEGTELDQAITVEGWQRLIASYKACILQKTGRVFPQDVNEQLYLAVEAVFRSWHNPRAQIYRKVHQIPDHQGTAVNIQSMVFGNMGDDSGTGVIFSRNPSNGENVLFGEYLVNAQGEDVVAGVRTPMPIAALENEMPAVYNHLYSVAKQLERHYKDMQDIEFTVENGKLYLLQTRSGKRNAQAAMKIAVDLVSEGSISKEDSLRRIEVSHLDQLLHRGMDESKITQVLATGLPASPGAATGQVVFDADTAVEWNRMGKRVILARQETTPEDIHGMIASEGVLTSRGGMTSHAAVVARGMGTPCICGCEGIQFMEKEKAMQIAGHVLKEGDWVTLDGTTGRVIEGSIPLREAEMTPELTQMLEWADEIRTLQVYTNADNPKDAETARRFGAEGIGLCRTEHMFFAPERLPVVQQMILADNIGERNRALTQLLPMQQADFEGIFRNMDGLPVTIRLLDPPLHEFLPNIEELLRQLSQLNGEDPETPAKKKELQVLIRKVRLLHETNPMLGQRGCRLGIVYPEIYDMQIEAIFLAADTCMAEGIDVRPELMVPLVGHAAELQLIRGRIEEIAKRILGAEKSKVLAYKVGTMIEVPRAALTAKQIVQYADFFSFGTNDLTQMTFGYSRDDAEGKFLTRYLDQKLLPQNPFQVLDTDGVGQLIEMAVAGGRTVKPSLKTGICGEHGGDKASILFCQRTGLNYVSCSPFRVPLARIAAAQAQLEVKAAEERTPAAVL
ncbi:pyruvate, phosphate dikinase [Paenibacillus spongiae]|uniref:Pyruvate, phosphate dikinase n=1 Tax=Paenibacillus spongiae TaxID=2909671 RepID=A0ABY5S6C1_9BACL|nr:pyruvate, phosphate dikinase [Paenibacillus spongiae]UVI28278.1 pyruvate, phosphate dikinase [Paenibacillus spongiae]